MKVELPFPWKLYVGKWLTLLYSASYFIFHSSYRPALLIFLPLKFLIALHWLTFHWRFVRTLLSLFSLFTLQTQTRMLLLIEQYLIILLLIRIAFVIIYEVFHGRLSLTLVPLLLLLTFDNDSWLVLMYVDPSF